MILFRLMLIVGAMALLSFLVIQNIVPSGELKIAHDFQSASPFVSPIYPEGRTEKLSDGVIVKEEPVYFDVRIPRKFSGAKLRVYYENLGADVFEAGLETTPGQKNFNFRPLQNKFLDNLDWPKIFDENYVLFARNGDFKTLEEFWRVLPPKDKIAVYRAPFLYNFKIPGYAPWGGERKIDTNLAGSFKFYTYIKNEPLNFKFVFRAGENFSPISARIFSRGEIIFEKEFVNLADTSDNLKHERTFRIFKDNLSEGAYLVEIAASRDILTKTIFGTPHLITFAPPLVFGVLDRGTELLTSAQRLYVKRLGDRQISFWADKREYELSELQKKYDIDISGFDRELKFLFFDGGNLEIDGDGLFAFAWNNYFNPTMPALDQAAVRAGLINYILTGYRGVASRGDESVAEADFDLQSVAASVNRKIKFVLSLPNLPSGAPGVKIKKVEVEFSGERAGWRWVRGKLRKLF